MDAAVVDAPVVNGAVVDGALAEPARAKINLTLHVTGRRADGYHLLDSLVVFADVGDVVSAEPADALSLSVIGPRGAGVPVGADNLVFRAAKLMAPGGGARLTLDKHLPAASGIGGGSADAAACLRVLAHLWGCELPPLADQLRLGADVPVCVVSRPCRMTGIGEGLAPVPRLPPVWLLLVNPGVGLETPQVFRALTTADHAPMPQDLPVWADAADLAFWLAAQRNDLQPAAIACAPVVGQVLDAVGSTAECLLARMSGSGATCFGVYASRTAADRAADTMRIAHPDWWVAATGLHGAGT
ncbi:4-diphosphocytidyl-2-C-methyl-D-erythritol kinase [Roseicitreum antarcticum]|uniref:4-diphosphocytidyl-2-C-methyl-D-erythritol kinase n=1 Tax=Roseicitreum antarcticum TaxID=564137 RepID=A0A1H2SA18_9RHOB|nr:4-diphosphocytidyl-2-C-methyl-D-erythritol kinase [Roseicitreum antarcticum]